MTEFFIRDEDEKLAQGAVHMDDLDLINSPFDGALVAVAMKGGRHVCWQCGEGFDESNPKYKRVEVKLGFSRILLHAQCEKGKPGISVYFNNVRGMQLRRKLASAARASQSIADTAAQAAKKLITG
jgi:hypothetical protein